MRSLFCCSTLIVLLLTPAAAFAQWRLPVKIDAGINARFNVYWQDEATKPRVAPWYTYFPNDGTNPTQPQMQSAAAASNGRFPSWPSREQWQQLTEHQATPKPLPMLPPADPVPAPAQPQAEPLQQAAPVAPPVVQQSAPYSNYFAGYHPVSYQNYPQVPYYRYGR